MTMIVLHGKDYCGVKVLGGRELIQNYEDAFVLAVPGSPKGYLKRKATIDSLAVEQSRFATIIHPSVVSGSRLGHRIQHAPHGPCRRQLRSPDRKPLRRSAEYGPRTRQRCRRLWLHRLQCIDFRFGLHRIRMLYRVGSKDTRKHQGGDRTLIGLGSNVISDIEKETVAVGNPARAIRKCFS